QPRQSGDYIPQVTSEWLMEREHGGSAQLETDALCFQQRRVHAVDAGARRQADETALGHGSTLAAQRTPARHDEGRSTNGESMTNAECPTGACSLRTEFLSFGIAPLAVLRLSSFGIRHWS